MNFPKTNQGERLVALEELPALFSQKYPEYSPQVIAALVVHFLVEHQPTHTETDDGAVMEIDQIGADDDEIDIQSFIDKMIDIAGDAYPLS